MSSSLLTFLVFLGIAGGFLSSEDFETGVENITKSNI